MLYKWRFLTPVHAVLVSNLYFIFNLFIRMCCLNGDHGNAIVVVVLASVGRCITEMNQYLRYDIHALNFGTMLNVGTHVRGAKIFSFDWLWKSTARNL
jgi:hypothetical protein